MERLEIEALWSKDVLTKIVKELIDREIKIPRPRQVLDDVNPLDVLASLGLEVIQDRESHREIRNIIKSDGGSPVRATLAELVIDSVVYRFNDQKVRYYEIEIEAKAENGSTVIKAVVQSLLAMYGPVLRVWDYGKLATGKAIEKLLDERTFKRLLDINGNLKLAAYDKIEDYLKGDGV